MDSNSTQKSILSFFFLNTLKRIYIFNDNQGHFFSAGYLWWDFYGSITLLQSCLQDQKFSSMSLLIFWWGLPMMFLFDVLGFSFSVLFHFGFLCWVYFLVEFYHYALTCFYYFIHLSVLCFHWCIYPYPLQGSISLFYTVVIPMLNPLIYSLRNRDVKDALRKAIVRVYS